MGKLRPFLALIVAILCGVLLYLYLTETIIVWRFALSGLTCVCAYLLVDGLLRFD